MAVPTTIESIDNLISILGSIAPAELRWFRGQLDATWDLLPSLHRGDVKPESEGALIKRFKQNAYSLVSPTPANDWDWLFLMQHHGAPTRLLDWSESPLVALFFASGGWSTSKADTDGALWLLDPVALNAHSHINSTIGGDLPFFGIDTELNPYRTEDMVQPRNKPPAAALAPRYFPRLSAQSGVFTVSHREPLPVNKVLGCACTTKVIVPAKSKPRLLQELSTLGISRLSLFPELDSVARHAREAVT